MDKNNQIINLNYPVTDTTYEKLSEVLSDFSSCNEYTNTSYIDGELRTFYNNLGDSTKRDITDITNSIELLGSTINNYVSTCKNIDETKYNELQALIDELYSSSNLISDYSDLTIVHKYNDEIDNIKKTIINKLGMNEGSPEARKLQRDIDNFILDYQICSDDANMEKTIEKNIKILNNFISKIPSNYSEYDKNYKWDSVPYSMAEYEGCKNYTEFFDVNGANIRLTSIVDVDNSYKSLQLLFNRVYCYNIVNEMKSWDQNYLDLIAKRKYIDVIVPDATTTAGAAHFSSDYPYFDSITLPTQMGGVTVYSDDVNYNYLFECLPHEMSHYVDHIVGVGQLKEFEYDRIPQEDKEFYGYIKSLVDDNMYEIELINKHGNLSNEEIEKFKNYKNDNSRSFTEGYAEFLRADLVDHNKFVEVIGKDNYDKLFTRLKSMNSRSENGYEYNAIINGTNNNVTIYQTKDGVRETLTDSYCCHYDKMGRTVYVKNNDEIFEYTYNDNNEIIKIITKDGNNNIIRTQDFSYIRKEEDGHKIYSVNETSSNGMTYEKTFVDNQFKSYKEMCNDGYLHEIEYENGVRIKDVYNKNEYYDNGNIKYLNEKYPDGREYHYEYRIDGTLKHANIVYADGGVSTIEYDQNGNEIRI